MDDRSELKRQLIVDTARRIFAEKGFAKVTMKDIIEASQISRGGIYLYFDSTASLFEEVLRQEEAGRKFLQGELPEEASAVDILLLFLKEQKLGILRKKDNLAVASYEYYFSCGLAGQDSILRRRFRTMSRQLAELIAAGVENGEFCCEDPESYANHILYLLEGMRVNAHTIGISPATVDRELLIIVQSLVIE